MKGTRRLQLVCLYTSQWVLHPQRITAHLVPTGSCSPGLCEQGRETAITHTHWTSSFTPTLKKTWGKEKRQNYKVLSSILLSISRLCSPSKDKTSSPLSKVQFRISYWNPSLSLCLCGHSQLHRWLSCVTAQNITFRRAPCDLMFGGHHLEILNSLWMRGLTFSSCTEPHRSYSQCSCTISKAGFHIWCQITKLSQTNKTSVSREFTPIVLCTQLWTNYIFRVNRISINYFWWERMMVQTSISFLLWKLQRSSACVHLLKPSEKPEGPKVI